MHELAYTFDSNNFSHQTKLKICNFVQVARLKVHYAQNHLLQQRYITILIQIICKIFMEGDKLISILPRFPTFNYMKLIKHVQQPKINKCQISTTSHLLCIKLSMLTIKINNN